MDTSILIEALAYYAADTRRPDGRFHPPERTSVLVATIHKVASELRAEHCLPKPLVAALVEFYPFVSSSIALMRDEKEAERADMALQ